MRWLIILTLSLMTATCGQKGPLYIPEASIPETHTSDVLHFGR